MADPDPTLYRQRALAINSVSSILNAAGHWAEPETCNAIVTAVLNAHATPPASEQDPGNDSTGLRDQIRRAICEAEGFDWDLDMLEPDEYGDHADAVLRVRDTELQKLHAERDELLAELAGRDEEARERWIQNQLDQTGLMAVDFRNGMTMEIEPARELVAHWIGAARAILGDAPNYTETPIEMEVKVAESPERFAFVLHRVGKLTPHQARQQAEAERDETQATLEAVRAVLAHWEGSDISYSNFATQIRAALGQEAK
ncbi:hypothetical protein [Streptomyces sp. WAC08241]|uniref:hypothetical protein n=1 Tax=Streptomyces sp. WAC08241 TaxID=2487421 RepID=UPI000F769467|nr:hypothetical protein [Streptomyces sp. WAC08241]RSS37457.1 hypothetical protein EF906_23060 [Streptomyces sp. WAC08241]